MMYSQSLVAGRELLALRSRSTTGDRLTDSSLIQSSSFSSSRRETLREGPRQGRKERDVTKEGDEGWTQRLPVLLMRSDDTVLGCLPSRTLETIFVSILAQFSALY